MEEDRKRHCWECRRRCLVCDSARPGCKRCVRSGTVCPGYDAKPSRLRWLAPGRITSRTPRLKGTRSNTTENKHDKTTTSTTLHVAHGTNDMLIPRFRMRTGVCAMVEGMEYFNTCIYQDLVPLHELGPNPHVYTVSAAHFQHGTLLPEYLRCGYICITLSHRINRTRNDPQSTALTERFYRYRGVAIRGLNEEIDVEYKRTSDKVLVGIITLLLVDAQQGASPAWRCHVEGIQKLVTLRGGLRALAGARQLESVLLCFLFIAVIGNTTSPASDLAMTSQHLHDLDFILEQFGGSTYAFHMCPPPLFVEIIRINHLRMRAASYEITGLEEVSQDGYAILSRIHGFSSKQWAESKPLLKEDWTLLGNIYQAAVAIYCISSLQSLSVLPLSCSLRAHCTTHGQLLQFLLNKALSSPRTKLSMLWPLVVLGMEAVYGDMAIRAFVQEQLPEMSRHLGTYVPLMAKKVLERFWASGETRWDACFDRPYAFATQIAVDTGHISPSY